jgi:hypothetical protein
MTGQWRLMAGDLVVGVINVTGGDFPWIIGTFQPTEAFDEFSDLFARELALVDGGQLEAHMQEFEGIWQEIEKRLSLVKPDGITAAEFLLHVRENEAWFRFSDDKFPVEPEEA